MDSVLQVSNYREEHVSVEDFALADWIGAPQVWLEDTGVESSRLEGAGNGWRVYDVLRYVK
jgi:hypothetical protein